MPTGIPDKGRILTRLSAWWLQRLGQPHHLVSLDLPPLWPASIPRSDYVGRCMVVHKSAVVPVECVVRGYLEGSGWKEYQRGESVCGVPLPSGLTQCARLPEPIFTPATKAESGHDENISFATMSQQLGIAVAEELRQRSLDVYARGAAIARESGLIIADTKFEWGWHEDQLILIDEVLTPDSSRFWPAAEFVPGRPQRSFDKQFLREWLEQVGWDKNSPPPALPVEVVEGTRQKYIEAWERLTGEPWSS
jgi:phosphoribosylaminoimidazole-succinocarboxamide synthase